MRRAIAQDGRLGHWRGTLPTPLPTASSFRDLLRQRDYLFFWASRWMGGLGVQIQSVAMGWQVYDLSRQQHLDINHASFNVSLIGLITFAPLFFLALPAGMSADRYDRKRIMMLCYTGELAPAAILAAAELFHFASVPLLLSVAVIFGTSRAFLQPASTALGPMLVLAGAARLTFADGEALALGPGDWVDIAPHRRHRVAWTDPDRPTVWLAVLPTVVREVSPKLSVKVNVPSPPTVFFTTWIDPGIVMVLVSNVTAPFCANARPVTVAPTAPPISIASHARCATITTARRPADAPAVFPPTRYSIRSRPRYATGSRAKVSVAVLMSPGVPISTTNQPTPAART